MGALAAAVAVALGFSLIAALAVIVVLVAVFVVVLDPLLPVLIVVLLTSVTFDTLPTLSAHSSAIARAEKLMVMLCLVPVLVARGLRDRRIPHPVIAYTAVFVFTFTLAHRDLNLDTQKAIFAFVTYNVGWMAASTRWTRAEATKLATAIALVAPLSVVEGALLQVAGQTTLVIPEYTGVHRLQGATIPAFLALLGAASAAGAVVLVHLGLHRRGYVLAAANVVIVALSGTRGGLIATILLLSPLAWRFVRRPGSRMTTPLLRALVGVSVLIAAAVAYAPVVIARTFNSTATPGGGINTSGRNSAWSYFLQRASASRIFGLGLGSGPLLAGEATIQRLQGDFQAQHNEYLHLYVEGGVVGFVLVLGAIVLFLSVIWRGVPDRCRPDVAALFAAFAFYSFVDNTVTTYLFFLPFGLVLSLYLAMGDEDRRAEIASGNNRSASVSDELDLGWTEGREPGLRLGEARAGKRAAFHPVVHGQVPRHAGESPLDPR
jgi:teichuronic acid biosynthesis protein TuaE